MLLFLEGLQWKLRINCETPEQLVSTKKGVVGFRVYRAQRLNRAYRISR